MESSLEGTRFVYRKGYEHHLPFMRFLIDLGIPLPEPLPCTAEFVLAFARKQENHWVLAAAARFYTQLASPGRPPTGGEVWGESVLVLPPEAPRQWVDILTGKTYNAKESATSLTLPLQSICQHLPLAFLAGSPKS